MALAGRKAFSPFVIPVVHAAQRVEHRERRDEESVQPEVNNKQAVETSPTTILPTMNMTTTRQIGIGHQAFLVSRYSRAALVYEGQAANIGAMPTIDSRDKSRLADNEDDCLRPEARKPTARTIAGGC